MAHDAGATCPDENGLVAFVARRLPASQHLVVQSHLDACDTCLALVCDLARADDPNATEADAAPPDLGSTVGRYRLVRMIGAGGMGAVFEAHDPQLDRRVAVKVLRADRVANPEARARLLREARAMAKLSHRNVVTVFDAGEAGPDRFFIAMEFLEGRTLGAWLRERERSYDEVLDVVLAAGRGLAAAHAAGIIHRDFKPENVLVDHDGRVAVADFGLAGVLEGSAVKGAEVAKVSEAAASGEEPVAPALTKTGTAFGTPYYMSPEQHAGGALDERTDQFSFAVTLHESLYGARPFAGATMTELREAVRAHRVADAATGAREVPANVRSAILKALSPDREDRFPSVSAFMAAVEAPSRGRSPRLAAVLFVVALAAIAAITAFARPTATRVGTAAAAAPSSAKAPPTAGSAPLTVLILGIENQTSDPDLTGTADEILSSGLARSPIRMTRYWGSYLRTLARELDSPKADESLGPRVLARDGGTVVLVRGAIAPKGAGYSVSLTATYAGGAALTTATRDAAEVARVVPTIGRLASDLRVALGEKPPPDAAAAEKTSMSLSIEADHEFILGSALGDAGKYAEAVAHLERAVELDPRFARAHHTLAIQLANLGKRAESIRAYERGRESLDTLSDVGQLQLLGGYYRAIGEFDEASATFAKLLELRPGESSLQTGLANSLFSAGDLPRALEIGRTAAAEHPHSVIPRSNVAWFEVATGDLEGAARDASAVLAEFPHPPSTAYVSLGVAEALLGHPDRAASALEKLAAIDPSLADVARADLSIFQGDAAGVASALERGIAADTAKGRDESAAVKFTVLGELRLARGDVRGALAAAESAATSGEVQTLYAAGALFARAGRANDAERIASVLGTKSGQDGRVYAGLVNGETARARGKYAEASRAFEETLAIRDAWLGHFGLAQTRLAAGDPAGAERELAICEQRRGEGGFAFSTHVPTLRLIARVRQGRAAKAR